MIHDPELDGGYQHVPANEIRQCETSRAAVENHDMTQEGSTIRRCLIVVEEQGFESRMAIDMLSSFHQSINA